MAFCRHLFQYRARKKYDTSSEALSKNAILAFEKKCDTVRYYDTSSRNLVKKFDTDC